MKKVIVISLGGSLIVPNELNLEFLEDFKKVIKKNISDYKFVIVCGGGSIARKYIAALKKSGLNAKLQSLAGIAVTRLNARFMSYFFNHDEEEGIPNDMKHVSNLLGKHDVVFCGALRYKSDNTSDGTAADLAAYLRTDFINLTNVKGLFDKNPMQYKNAKFIPKISKESLYRRVARIKFNPGQHFVIDQSAMKLLRKNKKVKLYILGKDLRQLDNLLNGKRFIGTIVD